VLVWHIAAPTAVSGVALGALTALLVGAWLWVRALARGLRAGRRLVYAAVQVGDELEEELTIDNAAPVPALWVEFVDGSDLPGYSVSAVRAADGESRMRWRAHAICAQRGLYWLGPWELRLGDPLGIFAARQVYGERQEVLVYPPLAPLPPELLPHTGQVGDHRRLRQPVMAETLSATTTRPYLPGDPRRHVHWPTTARRDELYTKVFDPEATSTIWLIPDFDADVHVGEGADSTVETMVLLAASLADHLLQRRLAVGMLAQAGEVTVVRPQAGKPHLWTLLRALAPLHAAQPLPLQSAIERLQGARGGGQRRPGAGLSTRDRLVVLTPNLNPSWVGALQGLSLRGGVSAILLDPASFDPQATVAGTAQASVAALADVGVPASVVRRGDLRPAEGTYGELRRWDFVTVGTGRAVARRRPRRAGNMGNGGNWEGV
jgi:uncharacterized protein (DUF58 family)